MSDPIHKDPPPDTTGNPPLHSPNSRPTLSSPTSSEFPRLALLPPTTETIVSGPPSPTASLLSLRWNTTSPTPERQNSFSTKSKATTQLSTNAPTIYHALSTPSLMTVKSFSEVLKGAGEPANGHFEEEAADIIRPALVRLRSTGQIADVASKGSGSVPINKEKRRGSKKTDESGEQSGEQGVPTISLSSSLSDAMSSLLPPPKLPIKSLPRPQTELSESSSLSSSPLPNEDNYSNFASSPKSVGSGELIAAKVQKKEPINTIITDRIRKKRVDEGTDEGEGDSWADHEKHFFVLSSAGKPVWTRYGDESRISSLMGLIQAIVSSFADGEDMIRSIQTKSHKFVFILKDPLYYVAISKTGESEALLRDQLNYLHYQILSVLTGAQLTRIFEERVNYDLRRLLGGTEVFLDSLSANFSRDHSFMLGAVECLKIPREVRDRVGDALAGGKVQDLLYAMIVARGKLVTLLRPRKHSLFPSDLHLLFNMLYNTSTFDPTFESWTPLCLPKFNPRGFLHAYIGGLGVPGCWMVMVSPERDSFFEIREGKGRVLELLEKGTGLEGLSKAIEDVYTVADMGIPGIRHFLYKNKLNVQFTMPEVSEFYKEEEDKKRLFRLYQYVHACMHSKVRPLKLYFHNSGHEQVLGWITTTFELYVTLGPLSKSSTIACANQLIRWIKKHEDMLFIMNSPVF